MKLSEAMMLGSTTCKMVPGDWNSCALGCAGNAVGVPNRDIFRFLLIQQRWPWLGEYMANIKLPSIWEGDGRELVASPKFVQAIATTFDEMVCGGKMTLEQLVDYVRSIEPECGECNRFKCSCPKTAAVNEPQSDLIHA